MIVSDLGATKIVNEIYCKVVSIEKWIKELSKFCTSTLMNTTTVPNEELNFNIFFVIMVLNSWILF